MIQETFNPIIMEQPYQSRFSPQIPFPGKGQAVLLLVKEDESRARIVVYGQVVTTSEIQKERYDYQVVMDLEPHYACICLEAPAMDGPALFRIRIDGKAAVGDPLEAYRHHITDAARYIEKEVEQKVRQIASGYRISEMDFFREEMTVAFAKGFAKGGILMPKIVLSVWKE